MVVPVSSPAPNTQAPESQFAPVPPDSAGARGPRRLLCYDPRGTADIIPREVPAAGWEISMACNVAEARNLIGRGGFEVGLFSIPESEPDIARRELEDLSRLQDQPVWIALLTRQGVEMEETRRLVGDYFFDYHTLPADSSRLLATLGHACGMARMRRQASAQLGADKTADNEIIGTSPLILKLARDIRKLAGVDAPILISGESGTGKELAARSIHRGSVRAGGPFVAVNCGALPASLIQSELFGHEKGSFTGAHKRHIGRFEAADHGTLFLDEIADLPLDLQVNLLRVIEEGAVERVGGTEPVPVDVRIIAASHKDLDQAVAEGTFREDLYFRVNVLKSTVPSLRDRGTDIELLAKEFLRRFTARESPGARGFTEEALRVMNYYTWPGNVRELINRVRRAAVMAEGPLVTPTDLDLDRRATERRMMTLSQARDSAEKRAIVAALMRNRNNVSQAARDLGVSRTTLYRFMEKHSLGA